MKCSPPASSLGDLDHLTIGYLAKGSDFHQTSNCYGSNNSAVIMSLLPPLSPYGVGVAPLRDLAESLPVSPYWWDTLSVREGACVCA